MCRLSLALILAFQVPLHFGKTSDGIPRMRADPAFVNVVNWKRIEVIPSLAPTSFYDDKIGPRENAQVQHDRAPI